MGGSRRFSALLPGRVIRSLTLDSTTPYTSAALTMLDGSRWAIIVRNVNESTAYDPRFQLRFRFHPPLYMASSGNPLVLSGCEQQQRSISFFFPSEGRIVWYWAYGTARHLRSLPDDVASIVAGFLCAECSVSVAVYDTDTGECTSDPSFWETHRLELHNEGMI
eukprot:TRINITY_DN31800_c0_g1_i1.p1 TRINITY_DN31800_c0_g1~~TRINITY_DN31800_c0_g1_i1.p1  ORF type:complete len:174 (-),score=12.82 TRINITY_DN31800_c0_g1_i1:82-573(-)